MNPLRWFRRTSPTFSMRRKLGPSLLYLDDIKHIYDMLVKLSEESAEETSPRRNYVVDPHGSIRISTGDITIETIEDLEGMGRKELNYLSIELSNPPVKVDLWGNNADVVTYSRSSRPRILVSAVQAYINSKRSSRVLFRSVGFTAYAIPLFLAAFLYQLVSLKEIKEIGVTLGVGISTLAVILAFNVFQYRSAVRIMPVWRHNSVRPARQSWIGKADSGGMTDNDFKFMNTLVMRMSAGDLSQSQVAEIERVLKALKSKPEIE